MPEAERSMLVASLELLGDNDKSPARVLGKVRICNDGTGAGMFGNYVWQTLNDDGSIAQQGYLTGWNRTSPPMELLAEVLKQALANSCRRP